ncbi:MAG: hypothetical protein HWN67_03725 [Candidatus Helarchaeota archaeon]|nr:hypothetical protein [Candidatus Helarchaeota archaeon]
MEINQTQKNIEFYNLYNCKAGDFTYPNYLAGWYIFGNTSGQVSISCSREGGFWYGTHDFYKDLSGGDSIGEAWKKMYSRGYKTNKYPTGFREPFPTPWQWMGNNYFWGNYTEGTNLFGDPTLQNCKKPTQIIVSPIPNANLTDNITITAQITDSDWWSLYNISLQFEYYNKGSWIFLGSNFTNIKGISNYTFNTTKLPKGRVAIRVSFDGSPNFFANNSIQYFEHGKIDNEISLLSTLLLITSTNPTIRDMHVIIISIGTTTILFLIIYYITIIKKKNQK